MSATPPPPTTTPPPTQASDDIVSLVELLQKRIKNFNVALDVADAEAEGKTVIKHGGDDDGDEGGMIEYLSAVEDMWQEAEHSMEYETEYWDRLNSAAFDGDYDGIETMAECWEDTYCKQFGKKLAVASGANAGPRNTFRREVLLDEDGNAIGKIKQNDAGPVAAVVVPPPASSSATPSAGPFTKIQQQANAMQFNPSFVLETVNKFDRKLRVQLGGASHIPTLTEKESAALVAAYDHMLTFLANDAELKSRYGAYESCNGLTFGSNVPSYFANVGGQSIFYRKALTVAGLRNLIHFGPAIYRDLQAKQFSGNPASYDGDVGLTLMRRVTGNVVDLDTTVLRCSDSATLNVINMVNKHKEQPTYATSSEFSSSPQAEEIAVHCAVLALENFAQKMKLNTTAQQRARKIAVDQITKPIPYAYSNTDRGHTPLWHYRNAGQDSFHANVPTMDDVVGALLRAPFHCVRHWATLHSGIYDGCPEGTASRAKVNDFFENCVVDSCFNMKWKAIEEFGEQLEKEGSIVDILQKLQMQHQDKFPAELFDADSETRDKEIEVMASIAVGQLGRDEKTKELRKITLHDVAEWVRST